MGKCSQLQLLMSPCRLVLAPTNFGRPAPITLQGPTDNTVALLFSRDGKQLVTNQVNWTSTVSLWDMTTGEKLVALPVQPKAVSSMALSSDGKQLATASLDRKLKLWDAKTGAELRSFTPVTVVFTGMAFSPDGKWLATTGHDREVKIWETAAGKVSRSFGIDRYFISGVDFSADGTQLASPAHQGFTVWDTGDWRESYFPGLPGRASGQSGQVAFSSGGKRLVVATDAGVHVWDAEAWREILARPGPPFSAMRQALALSHDGNFAATAEGNGSVRLWYLSPMVVPRPVPGTTAR